MTDIAALFASVAIPWITGTLGMLAVAPLDRQRWLRALGYGYFLGLFAVTLVLRLLDLAGVRWTLVNACATLVPLLLLAGWRAHQRRSTASMSAAVTGASMPPLWRMAFIMLVLLTAMRIGLVSFDALTLPLTPVDTWSQWASKSRVWYAYRELVPFVDPAQWARAAGVMHFTDSHPAYPPTVPLFQVWAALWLGRWDESLVNVAWPVALLALALAFYAELRRFELRPLPALFVTYALASLPFLTIYVALPGLADLFVASAYALAAASAWHWARRRERGDALVAIAMALFCAALKREGLLWDLTLVPAVLIAIDRRLGAGALAAAGAMIVAYVLFGPAELAVSDYVLLNRFQNVLPILYDHFLVMDNWHLLWYVAIAMIAFRWRVLTRDGVIAASVSMLAAMTFVFVVFSFTSVATGVEDESLANRLPLEMVPALVLYLALLVREGQSVAEERKASGLAVVS